MILMIKPIWKEMNTNKTIYDYTDDIAPISFKELNNFVYNLIDLEKPLDTTNKYTIYILSKGRAGRCKTVDLLKNTGLKYKLVVEPQDYDLYCSEYSSDFVIQMDENNMGVSYVRNFIKKYSTKLGEKYHWQLDDDISRFLIRKKGTTKNILSTPLICISVAEYCTDMFSNISISGICSSTYAFSKKYAVQSNRLAYQCMLINNNTEIEFANLRAGVDWDYTLRSLEHGYCTLAFYHIMQESAPTGVFSGGNTEIAYIGNKRKLSYESFIELWPGRFSIKEFPKSNKRWRLNHIRRFFNDYKQELKPNTNLSSFQDILKKLNL